MEREFKKPAIKPGEIFERFEGAEDPAVRYAAAHDTAWALLYRVRQNADPELVTRVIDIAQHQGIDDIARLWMTTPATSLPGLLWRLYLVKSVVSEDPEHASLLFDRGSLESVTIDPIVAGVKYPISPDSVRDMCDEILRGAFTGDFAIALERAASACSVFAAGATHLADQREIDDEVQSTSLTRQALRFTEMADDLKAGARAWRSGLVQ